MDGAGFEAAAQNRRGESADDGAIENGDGDDFGLDCTTFADGLLAYGGKWFGKIVVIYNSRD